MNQSKKGILKPPRFDWLKGIVQVTNVLALQQIEEGGKGLRIYYYYV